MIIESLLGIGVLANVLTSSESKEDRKIKSNIKDIWVNVIESLGRKAENTLKVDYELLEVFIKEYGFDAIVSLPYGTTLFEFRKIIPSLEVAYKSEIIANYSKGGNSLHIRCHILSIKDFSESEKIRFTFLQTFFDEYNKKGESYSIKQIKELKGDKDELVGYSLNVNIPNGFEYKDLLDKQNKLKEKFKKCFVIWDDINNCCRVEIITKEREDNEKFTPVKIKKPYEIFIGKTYTYKDIISDLSTNPHFFYTGASQTGKTVCALTGITNIAYHFDENDFWWFGSMISAKQDLKVFKNLKCCKYYASNVMDSLKMFRFIKKEMFRRNKLFETSKKGHIGSMYEWNKKYPHAKLPFIIVSIDEMSLYTPRRSDSESVKKQKNECLDLITQIIIEGASSGINLMFSLQRPDKDSFNPMIKAQVQTKIGFYQPNSATSLVAMDDTMQTTLAMKREAIIKYNKGTEVIKTQYLNFEMIEDLLKNKIDKNYPKLNLDAKGNIIENEGKKNNEKTTKNEENNSKNGEKQSKNDKKPTKTSQIDLKSVKDKLKKLDED